MRTRRWAGLTAATATLTALTVTALPNTASAAAQTLNITVGGDAQVSGVVFEGMRFLVPGTLKVHKGDILTFGFAGFHTATLLPAGVGATDWRQDNATGVGGPTATYSPIVLDQDDATTPPTFMFNNNVLFPTDPTCGTATSPCAYDGKSVLNSGLPLAADSFSATINANPGDSFWVVCLIHGMMQMRVQVVPDTDATTTQDAINTYASTEIAAEHEQAAALIPRLNQPSSHKTSSGATVWDAFAGFDGDGWGLNGMFPKRLVVLKGDKVRWHFAQLTGNIHTVTFPKSAAAAYADTDFSGQNVKCEGANGGPDTAPDAAPPVFCSAGPQAFEAEIRGAAVVRMGTAKYDGTGYHSSGVEGADAGQVAPYTLKFTKRSGKIGFKYACAVHGSMMHGKVVVK